MGPLLFETTRHGWNNSGLACDFARNLAKHGIATWSDVTEWGTGEVLTWPQMKRVYGLRVGAAAKGVEVGGDGTERTRTGR